MLRLFVNFEHVELSYFCTFEAVSTLPLGVKVLRHAQQLQHLLRKLSPADIVAGEAKYTKVSFCILQAPT